MIDFLFFFLLFPFSLSLPSSACRRCRRRCRPAAVAPPLVLPSSDAGHGWWWRHPRPRPQEAQERRQEIQQEEEEEDQEEGSPLAGKSISWFGHNSRGQVGKSQENSLQSSSIILSLSLSLGFAFRPSLKRTLLKIFQSVSMDWFHFDFLNPFS